MTVALLFPGQGTQHAGMLPWLAAEPAAQPVLGALAQRLGVDWRSGLDDLAWSQSNAVAQLLVTGISLASWAALAKLLPTVVAVAGYSVGEVAACVAAGMLDVDDGLALASMRAAEMDRCAAAGPESGLLAVSGIGLAEVSNACKRWHLEIAIRCSTDRFIIGGPLSAFDTAAAHLQAHGAHTNLLGVRVASHTRAMRAAVPELQHGFSTFDWKPPRIPWVSGSRGSVLRSSSEVRQAMAEQVATVLVWDRCMDTLAERRPDCVLELGPGTTLARMWRERFPDIPVRSCEDFNGAAAIGRWLRQARRI